MNNLSLFQELEKLLRMDSKYCTEDGALLKNAIVEAALDLRPDLIKLLLSHEGLKNIFFKDIDGILVFDKVGFQKFVMNKRFLPDSYTSFKNKVGLTNEDGDFLSESGDVVLSWPYKDCILEGGQTEEDAKRNEVFWNEILAPDEINRLTEPKVLTGFKKYDANGEHEVESISMEDNLIVKGNNLLALYSLKNKYAGQVKLIYIDPPYNTGSDSFGYNDSFNHATWYTFIRNRLEIAKKLLSKDGIICVQCSFHEFAYLKLLMDEIFPKFLCTFNIQVRHPDRILTGDKEYNDIIEYTLIYSNSIDSKMPKRVEKKTNTDYIYDIKEIGEPSITYFDNKLVKIYTPDKYKVEIQSPNEMLSKPISVRGSIREKNSSGRLYVKFIEPIASQYPHGTIFKVEGMGDDSFGFRRFFTPLEGNKNGGYFQGKPTSSDITEKPYPNFYNYEFDYNNVKDEGGIVFRNGKKPESYIKFLISIFTNESDVVLDFFLGSGTTGAVAHKLRRKYIGIEQMPSQIELIKKRLLNVINGDTTGISKSINWQGGGSFIYCELSKANQEFADKIEKADTEEDLMKIWEQMQKTGFLSWEVKIKEINNAANSFEKLPIEDQKRFLIECLDKNLLYIPYSEIDNKEFEVSDKDKILNNKFYGK